MAQKKKVKNTKKAKNKGLIIGCICGGVGIIAIIIAVVVFTIVSSTPKKIKLSPDQSVAVASMNLAIAMDRLNGGGSVTSGTCETFRSLAKQYDSETDWFRSSYCKFIIYANYNDTENTTTITLSDGTHAAIYTFSSNNEQLENYEFVESAVKGYGILIK